jgi:UDP-N-acetylglucosamine 2-epimerase
MKVLTVVGNRPQFVKAAAVSGVLRGEHEEVLVHTGQHYDDALSGVFFRELGLARPERELGIGGGSNASQVERMVGALAEMLPEVEPDAVLVYGDTNSTLAGAQAGELAGVPIVHVEAGMRSFDDAMPEEVNRIATDRVSSLLLCSSEVARENLLREGIAGRAVVVGDVMVDVALRWQPRARERTAAVALEHGVEPGEYLLVTAHRAGNVDEPGRLRQLFHLLCAVALQTPLVFPVHPRTRERLKAAGLWEELLRAEGVHVAEPLGYAEFTALLCGARAMLTDSGGVQKEAYLAGVRCVTLRPSTEWVETVESDWNTLVDLDLTAALQALERAAPAERPPLYGDGHAAERCVTAIAGLCA